ncbi:hypothetical protein EMWEY_00048770 [Eimeria maxima]|uniref:Uncharacterized protein n=1 Tax=Eimeria maxima TaxID=5804 RepID=U6LVX6_EIMMA|nr:hypothetical protein EMWEY_00048770 [Eimeria maxima]CDJ56087.1 hypothetical protein EMWEY_00048770 [Eimeria maxima]
MDVEYLEIPIKNAAPGVRESILTMRVNERAIFLLSPSLFIPSNTTNISFSYKDTAAAREAAAAAKQLQDGGPGGGGPEGPQQLPLSHRPRMPLEQQQKVAMLQHKLQQLQQMHLEQQQQLQQQQYDDSSVVQLDGQEWLM